MKTLNKYFTRQITGSFVGFGLILGGLAWMVQILLLMKLIVKHGVDVGGFLGMSVYTFPMLVGIIAPFVIFIAVMFVYNRSISHSEIAVCYAAGIRPMSAAWPAIKTALIVMILHFGANLWLTPRTQDMFYGMQWELRYGLGQLKLKESQFNGLMDGVVIYVERVSKKDLSGIIIRDDRAGGAERIISAENGKLVGTQNGLSIVMGSGGMVSGDGGSKIIGTFDGAEMDMGLSASSEVRLSRPRRASTPELIGMIRGAGNHPKGHAKKIMAEAANRFVAPLLDLLFALLAAAFLLKTSLLRRRASYASLGAALAMVAIEIAFMSASTTFAGADGLAWLGGGVAALILAMLWWLWK